MSVGSAYVAHSFEASFTEGSDAVDVCRLVEPLHIFVCHHISPMQDGYMFFVFWALQHSFVTSLHEFMPRVLPDLT